MSCSHSLRIRRFPVRLFVALLCLSLLSSTILPGRAVSSASTNSSSDRRTVTGAIAQAQAPRRENELLIRFRPVISEQQKEGVAATIGGRRKQRLRGESGVERIEVPASRDLETTALQLLLNPAVEFAEPNFLIKPDQLNPIVPDDARFGEQWSLRNLGDNGGQFGSDVDAGMAWHTTTGSRNTVIAVVDSGIDFTHPDLVNNQWTNPNPVSGDPHGWDFVTDSGEIRDEYGHGTKVAGIIAAEGNNLVGVSGVMWRASLMSLRVLDATATGDIATAVEAIDYAVMRGAHVINLSWGTSGNSLALRDAIERAIRRGVVVVCSAGNGGQNLDVTPYYPASYELNGLVSVAASDNMDQLPTWSNWSDSKVTVAAPGVNLLTTQMGGGYANVSGTSAAAAVVSGVVGLLKTANSRGNPQLVAKAITDGVRPIVSLQGKVTSGGVVSASGALKGLRGSVNQPMFPTPGFGTGGQGPGGSFNRTPPPTQSGAPPGFIDQDVARNTPLPEPQAPTFINANDLLPECDTTCGGDQPPPAGGSDPYFATARLLPENEVGGMATTGGAEENLGSRNFSWGVPVVSLAGRAGLDLNIGLFYNSLVWTKQGTSIAYNADHGFPGPGFRLGFPILQAPHVNQDTGQTAYMMITSSGGRVELRYTGVTGVYQSADGSYTRLTESGSNRIVRTTNGTQLTFVYFSTLNEYRCTQIKDRNGNFITINYGPINGNSGLGRPTSAVDTLGRTINFNYDGQNYLTSITQSWRRETLSGAVNETHTWANFVYGTLTLQPNFPGLTVLATTNQAIPVLTAVGFPDNSSYHFNYQPGWGMVNKIQYFGPTRLLRHTSYNIPTTATAHSDCPRFTERRDWGQFWNGDTDAIPTTNEEAVTTFSVATDNSWSKVIFPDLTMYKEKFSVGTNWERGLPVGSEQWTADEGAGGVKKKWTTTSLDARQHWFELPAKPATHGN